MKIVKVFLVMMALTSPILITIVVRNYFKHKTKLNQTLITLQ